MVQHVPATQTDLLPTGRSSEPQRRFARRQRRPGRRRCSARQAIAGLLFVLPWLILSLLVFTTYPVLATFSLSFTDYSVIQSAELDRSR